MAVPKLLARMVLSYKNYRWLYEREWRMFAHQAKALYRRVNCVSHVYLGSQMSQTRQEEVAIRLRALNIKVSVMVIDEYSIGFEKYPGSP